MSVRKNHLNYNDLDKSETELIIDEFNAINFSNILKESFHVTINKLNTKEILITKGDLNMFSSNKDYLPSENLLPETMTEKMACDENNPNLDTSIIIGQIITNAALIPRSLFCPFCADEYMFEFTLKDHLKKMHLKEINTNIHNLLDISNVENNNINNKNACPYCGALFYHLGLLPKHITKHHNQELLRQWRNINNNLDLLKKEKDNEPSICYAACSPGLSDVFDNLNVNTSPTRSNNDNLTPKLRSILKKTPNKSIKFISSPSSASINRNKSCKQVKRSLSARRVLRFDVPPSPPCILNNENNNSLPQLEKIIKNKKNFNFKWKINLFKRLRHRRRNYSKQRTNNVLINMSKHTNNIITSTPINYLDDDNNTNNQSLILTENNNYCSDNNNRNIFPFESSYQCAYCEKTWDNNLDLLLHHNDNHKNNIKYYFCPSYKCGQCGIKFYRNSFLVRHCLLQHL